MQSWYYSVDGKKKEGPISKEKLVNFINQGHLNSRTLVWQEGMSEWVYVSTIDSLFPQNVPPPLPDKSSKIPYPPLNQLKTPPLPTYNVSSSISINSSIPPEIKGWNWGAFLLGAIWSIGNRVWIGLLCFIPYVGFGVLIYLAIKGNELAWKNGKWKSIEQFKSTQKKWATAGFVIFVLSVCLGIVIAAVA